MQADCGSGDVSGWNGPASETTLFACPPNAVCATYNAGNIPTDFSFTSLPGVSTCPGSMSVVIPTGNVLDSVETYYDMKHKRCLENEQRSWLWSPTLERISDNNRF